MERIKAEVLFQFLIVRLKYAENKELKLIRAVSIPYSTIKIYSQR